MELKSLAPLTELARWERFTLRRWGKPNSRPFEIESLPDDIAFEVSAALLNAGTPDEARGVFAAARQSLLNETVEVPVTAE